MNEETLLAIIASIIVLAYGIYATEVYLKPINEACAKTNETIIYKGIKINCYDWKYNLTLSHFWPC
jgi:hypothetical protein